MNKQSQTENEEMWNVAIADVEQKIAVAEKRVIALRAARRSFEIHKEQGLDWPSPQSESQTSESATQR